MEHCPCGSGAAYLSCCEPYIAGNKDPFSAESLMRSRYTAYAKHRLSYIEETTHPRSREKYDRESTREWAIGSEWLGLSVLSTDGGQLGDREGKVEFIARYRSKGEEVEHHEHALFRRENGKWYFVDGKVQGDAPIERDSAKVGRNDPCPCGSGKKYKKCCGK